MFYASKAVNILIFLQREWMEINSAVISTSKADNFPQSRKLFSFITTIPKRSVLGDV